MAEIKWTKEKKEQAIELVLSCISQGQSLISVIRERSRDEVPSRSTFNEWLCEDEQLADKYARACEDRQELLFEQIIEIADDNTNDKKILDDGREVPDNEFISRSRLRVDARKWALSKMNPKKYGDKTDITTNGESIKQTDLIVKVKRNDDSNN